MAKIMIYVPDDLHRRLMEHRGRMNFSRIAQAAFRERIARGARPAAEIPRFEDLPTSLPDAPGAWWLNGGVLCRTPEA